MMRKKVAWIAAAFLLVSAPVCFPGEPVRLSAQETERVESIGTDASETQHTENAEATAGETEYAENAETTAEETQRAEHIGANLGETEDIGNTIEETTGEVRVESTGTSMKKRYREDGSEIIETESESEQKQESESETVKETQPETQSVTEAKAVVEIPADNDAGKTSGLSGYLKYLLMVLGVIIALLILAIVFKNKGGNKDKRKDENKGKNEYKDKNKEKNKDKNKDKNVSDGYGQTSIIMPKISVVQPSKEGKIRSVVYLYDSSHNAGQRLPACTIEIPEKGKVILRCGEGMRGEAPEAGDVLAMWYDQGRYWIERCRTENMLRFNGREMQKGEVRALYNGAVLAFDGTIYQFTEEQK